MGAATGPSKPCMPGIFLAFCAIRQRRVTKCVLRVTFPGPQIRRPRVHPPGLCRRAGRAAANALASQGRESTLLLPSRPPPTPRAVHYRPGHPTPARLGKALPLRPLVLSGPGPRPLHAAQDRAAHDCSTLKDFSRSC